MCTGQILRVNLPWAIRIVIQWNPDFFEPPRETKIGSKNQIVCKIGGKITVFN